MATYSQIIELNQINSDSNDNINDVNGTFTSTIKQSINIEEGDQINIRNIFIDSKKQSNTIYVKTDTVLTMKFIPFVNLNTDYEIGVDIPVGVVTDKQIFLNKDNGRSYITGNTITNQRNYALSSGKGDTFSYTSCKVATVGNEFSQLTSITVNADNISQFYGDYLQYFLYTDTQGPQEFSIYIPKLNILSDGPEYEIDLNGEGVIFKTVDGIKVQSSADFQRYNIKSFEYKSTTFNTDNTQLSPNEKTINITIKAGNYQPSILANIITNKINAMTQYFRKLSDNDADVGDDRNDQPVTNDKRLNGVYTDLRQGATIQTYQENGIDHDYYYYLVSEDDSSVRLKLINQYLFNDNSVQINTLYGGCTNFSLAFDNDTNTFKIPNMHTPYYASIDSGSGTTSSQIGYKLSNLIDSNANVWSYLDTMRSEIRITKLSSSNLDKTDNSNFWFDSLGLDPSIITIVGTKQGQYQSNGGGVDIMYVPTFSFNKKELSVNYTDAYIDSSFMIKNEAFNPSTIVPVNQPIFSTYLGICAA